MKGMPIFLVTLISCFNFDVWAEDSPILYELDQPFRLFSNDAFNAYRTAWEKSTKGEWQSIMSSTDPDSLWSNLQSNGTSYQNTRYNSKRGEYDEQYVHPKDDAQLRQPAHFYLREPPTNAICSWWINGEIQTEAPCESAVPLILWLGRATSVTVNVSTIDGKDMQYTRNIYLKDKLIIGLGDSYSSGEGNPDKATRFNKIGFYKFSGWINNSDNLQEIVNQEAQWWDTACHRSLWSWQVLTALRIALEDPTQPVTFLSFACSGAETTDGLFKPQKKPPGGRSLHHSQITAAVRELCPNHTVDADRLNRYEHPATHKLWSNPGQKNIKLGFHKLRCAAGEMRKPDLVLLGIGGNDTYFAPLLTGIVSPAETRSSPLFKWWWDLSFEVLIRDSILGVESPSAVERRINTVSEQKWNAESVSILADQFQLSSKTQIVVLGYPKAVPDRVSRCIPRHTEGLGYQTGAQAFGSAASAPFVIGETGWVAELTREEVRTVAEVQNSLIEKHAESFQKAGTTFNTWGKDTISVGRDICTYEDGVAAYTGDLNSKTSEVGRKSAENMLLAAASASDAIARNVLCDSVEPDRKRHCGPETLNKIQAIIDKSKESENQLFARNYADFQPYAPRKRLLRSLNDSILTQMVWENKKQFHIDIASTISGAFHPTAEAHAIAADSAWDALLEAGLVSQYKMAPTQHRKIDALLQAGK